MPRRGQSLPQPPAAWCAIVNVSSHQAQRPVRGALPYTTAKAAIEGLTRAVAVDHGPEGIRTNAVALGSIATVRYAEYRAAHPEVDGHMAALHPLGRVGRAAEVADIVAFLLSDHAGFINGVTLPIDVGAPRTCPTLKRSDARCGVQSSAR